MRLKNIQLSSLILATLSFHSYYTSIWRKPLLAFAPRVHGSMDEKSVEELYDIFSLQSADLPEVVDSFRTLKQKLKVEKLYGLKLYKELKVGLAKVWKAKELLGLLDKRANQKEYMGQVSIEFIVVVSCLPI